MINIISQENITAVNEVAVEILAFAKSKKFFITSKYSKDERIKGSTPLFLITRAGLREDRFNSISSANEADKTEFLNLIEKLSNLLENNSHYLTYKLKDYSLDIKPKLCRELVSQLEDMFIFGEIEQSDIEDVYATLGKNVPKKFSQVELDSVGKEIYNSVSRAIQKESTDIKANTVTHYMDMVSRIDPEDKIITPIDFINVGRKKISDMNTLRLCLACKFENEKFRTLIDQEFSNLVWFASSKIADKCSNDDSDNVSVDVKDISIGGKGFDIIIDVNGKVLNARAIPVEGCYVRFHYRYIIS